MYLNPLKLLHVGFLNVDAPCRIMIKAYKSAMQQALIAAIQFGAKKLQVV